MPRRSYTPAEVDTALLVLAMSGRNRYEASRRLKAEGVDVDRRTLNQWKNHTHAARYLEIEHDHAPKIEKQMVNTARAIVTAANEGTLEAIEAAREELREGKAKDASTVARNLATAAGIQTDKMLVMSGRPNEITASADDLQAAMERMARRLDLPQSVDSTAPSTNPQQHQSSVAATLTARAPYMRPSHTRATGLARALDVARTLEPAPPRQPVSATAIESGPVPTRLSKP